MLRFHLRVFSLRMTPRCDIRTANRQYRQSIKTTFMSIYRLSHFPAVVKIKFPYKALVLNNISSL